MKKQTILITGATGYIGSALALHLHQKFGENVSLCALIRPSSSREILQHIPITYKVGDLLKPPSLWEAIEGVDIVFHSAALVSFQQKDYRLLYKSNVVGTRNLVNACLRNNIKRFIHISSTAAIGINENAEINTETSTFQEWQQRIGYMASKYLGEFEVLRGIAEGLDAVILNPSIVIGDAENQLHSASGFIADFYQGRFPYFPIGGSGFVNLNDLLSACQAAWHKGVSGERYIINSENISYKNLIERISKFKGSRARTSIPLPASAGIALGILSEIISFLLQTRASITMDSMNLSSRLLAYDNSKSIKELGISYTSIDETIRAILARRNLLQY